jgi:hypothetical protein
MRSSLRQLAIAAAHVLIMAVFAESHSKVLRVRI